MVYTKLIIVSGLMLTKEQIITALKQFNENLAKMIDGMSEENLTDALPQIIEDYFLEDADGFWDDNKKERPHLFQFPCCSENKDKLFLIGYNLHTYYRRCVHCRDCQEYTVCDKCIGETSGGWYDVGKILDGPVIVARDKMCLACNSDQMDAHKRCRCCFRNAPKDDYKTYYEENLIRFATEVLKMTPETCTPAYYYMLDDCLSCT